MRSIRHLPREVQGIPLDVIAPNGGFGSLIEMIRSRPQTELMLRVIDHHDRELVLSVTVSASNIFLSSRGEEVFIENTTASVLDQYGNETGLQADAWISLNPEVKTTGLPAGKIIIWNPHPIAELRSKRHGRSA